LFFALAILLFAAIRTPSARELIYIYHFSKGTLSEFLSAFQIFYAKSSVLFAFISYCGHFYLERKPKPANFYMFGKRHSAVYPLK